MLQLLVGAAALVLQPAAFLSGGIAGALSHTALVPVDVVKTRQQNQPDVYSGGLLESGAKLVRADGPGALLAGSGPTLVGYFLHAGLKYGLYEAFKPEAVAALAPLHAPALAVLLSAALAAELLASCALCPLEAVRIRAVCNPAYEGLALDAGLAKLGGGPRGAAAAFDGLLPTLLKTVPFSTCQFACYELARVALTPVLLDGPIPDGRLAAQLLSATLAAVVGALASQPGDTLLSQVNDADESCAVGEEGICAPSDLLRLAAGLGVGGLYRGTVARLLHVTSIVVIQLLANDQIRAACGLVEMGTSIPR